MELDIKDLAITIAVGATVLFGGEFVSWLFFRNNIYIRLRDHCLIPHQGSTAMMLSISLALGLIVESAADPSIREQLFRVSGFEEVMLRQLATSDGKPMALGAELAERRLFSRIDEQSGGLVEDALCSSAVLALPEGQFSHSAWRLYYHAKNVVLADATYSKEMLSIQQRIDFAAAFALALMIILSMLLSAFVLKWIVDRIKPLDNAPTPFWGFDYSVRRMKGGDGSRSDARYFRRIACGLVVLVFSGVAASNYAYATQTGEYVRRAFGYYSTAAEVARENQLQHAPTNLSQLPLTNRPCAARGLRQRDA